MKKYIHYGDAEFRIEKFDNFNGFRPFMTKPIGGIWASPVDTEWGWKDWCESEDYPISKEFFTFSLAENANVLLVDSADKAKLYQSCILARTMPFDAVELSITDYPGGYQALNGWDCDSIVILNPDIIICDKREA